jgi:hypothetical protein
MPASAYCPLAIFHAVGDPVIIAELELCQIAMQMLLASIQR